MKNVDKIIILFLVILALFLRLYRLGSYPALNADEAAIGYNAYSLLQTGKDEHGNPWPVHFQSFNDYKPGLYVYMVMPFVKLFGLNEWSVRLPNAILGAVSVYVLYLLVKEMGVDKLLKRGRWKVELLAPALLTISPWHLHFSRGGWEVNTALFFILFAVFLFLKYINGKNKYALFLSVFFFVLSLYTYHSARMITPLLVLGMVIINWKELAGNLRTEIKNIGVALFVGLLFLLPLALDITKSEIVSRATGVGILADVGPIERTNEQRMEHKGIVSEIMHNKVVNYGLTFLKNWGEHYHGLFLFVSGDEIQRNRVPETGQLYIFEIITILAGLYIVLKERVSNSKTISLLIFWIIIAPIPAALTFQSPHALRSQNMVIPLTVISAIGLSRIFEFVEKIAAGRNYRFAIYLLFFVSISLCVSRYFHMYYLHMSKEYQYSSQYGVKELVSYMGSIDKTYEKIAVTNKYDQPYILFLFYLKYPPDKFQKGHVLTEKDKYGFSTVDEFSNYVFKKIEWDNDKLDFRNGLIIGADEEIPDETNITKRIYGSNDFLYFKIVVN